MMKGISRCARRTSPRSTNLQILVMLMPNTPFVRTPATSPELLSRHALRVPFPRSERSTLFAAQTMTTTLSLFTTSACTRATSPSVATERDTFGDIPCAVTYDEGRDVKRVALTALARMGRGDRPQLDPSSALGFVDMAQGVLFSYRQPSFQ